MSKLADRIIISTEEAKRFLRVSFSDDDQLISNLIKGSLAAADAFIGDAFGPDQVERLNDHEQYADDTDIYLSPPQVATSGAANARDRPPAASPNLEVEVHHGARTGVNRDRCKAGACSEREASLPRGRNAAGGLTRPRSSDERGTNLSCA